MTSFFEVGSSQAVLLPLETVIFMALFMEVYVAEYDRILPGPFKFPNHGASASDLRSLGHFIFSLSTSPQQAESQQCLFLSSIRLWYLTRQSNETYHQLVSRTFG